MARMHRYGVDEDPSRLLVSAGIRLTPQRVAILRILDGAEVPLSVETIRRALAPLTPGIPTVYRTLHLFAKRGWVKTVFLDGEACAHFVRARTSGGRQRILCRRCGRPAEMDSPMFKKALVEMAALSGYRALHHQLSLTGICPACLTGYEET